MVSKMSWKTLVVAHQDACIRFDSVEEKSLFRASTKAIVTVSRCHNEASAFALVVGGVDVLKAWRRHAFLDRQVVAINVQMRSIYSTSL